MSGPSLTRQAPYRTDTAVVHPGQRSRRSSRFAAVATGGVVEQKGLKEGALGFVSSVVIGVASTAPGYSLAAVLTLVVAAVGLQAPTILILAFLPGFLLSKPENSESGDSWLDVGPPLVIGLGFLLLGVVLMLLWRGGHPDFFRRNRE